MSERIELRVHDFLAEGRDESKSHVLLEIAQPAANEVATHGHFFALAELSGATPKTIQMVRAWVEFAIESYYKSVPTNIESHFEAILGQLNTQSALYLKQHAHEEIHMAVAAVCNSMLYLAVHGKPAALLFYRKDDAWRSMDMVDPNSADQSGQLFSNVVNGAMRVDDQFLLATPRVTEFFSADRLTKISEGKSMQEVNDHMLRVLSEMSSDYSFAGVWLKLVRTFDETQEIMRQKVANDGPKPEKKSDLSMSDLMNKTRSTAAILAPPVLTIPKDKIVTNLLKLAQKTAVQGAKAVVAATETSIKTIKSGSASVGVAKITERISLEKIVGSAKNGVVSGFGDLPQKRKLTMLVATGVLVVAILAIGGIAFSKSHSAKLQAEQEQLGLVSDKLRAANESFTYQNEAAARTTLAEAESLFNTLPTNVRNGTNGIAVQADITEKHNRILHITAIQPTAFDPAATAVRDIVSVGAYFATLSTQGDITLFKDGAKKIGSAPGAEHIFYDESNKRIVAELQNRSFKSFSIDGKKSSDISASLMPENAHVDAAVFYSGRLYAYDAAAQMIFRYDGSGDAYSSGKRWIVDSGKPSGVVELSTDNSVWMKTTNGSVIKYTAGKLQGFKISGATPDVTRIDQILTSTSGQIYFLDATNHRILQTARDGKLTSQFVYPQNTQIARIALDKNETNVVAVTSDGAAVRFDLGR